MGHERLMTGEQDSKLLVEWLTATGFCRRMARNDACSGRMADVLHGP